MGAQLGDVKLNAVYSEKPGRSVKATDHPVEGAENIVDHITKNPYVMGIDGVVTGEDAAVRLHKLEFYQDNAIPLIYSCRNWVSGVIIETFNSDHGKDVAGGFLFSMTLKKIKIAEAVPIEALALPARVQVKSVGNKGVQQPQTAGAIKQANGKTPAQLAAANANRVQSSTSAHAWNQPVL